MILSSLFFLLSFSMIALSTIDKLLPSSSKSAFAAIGVAFFGSLGVEIKEEISSKMFLYGKKIKRQWQIEKKYM